MSKSFSANELRPELASRLKVARQALVASDEVIRKFFRLPGGHWLKEGPSPIVTVADCEAERAIREVLEAECPEDGILGEELGAKNSLNGFSWVIDPIDGTSSFVRGFPIFGTLIALVDRTGQPVIGICRQPILEETFFGCSGRQSWWERSGGGVVVTDPLRPVPATGARLKDACLSATTPSAFSSPHELDVLASLARRTGRVAYGGDCFSYMMLAAGATSMPLVVVEAGMKYHDFCALVPILTGAGAAITDWTGAELAPDSTQVLAASSAALLEEALGVIGSVSRA